MSSRYTGITILLHGRARFRPMQWATGMVALLTSRSDTGWRIHVRVGDASPESH